jgi:hypothetical protein
VLGEHHDWSVIGYEGLLARARQEQRTRYDLYRAELHDQIPAVVEMGLPLPDPPAPASGEERAAAVN